MATHINVDIEKLTADILERQAKAIAVPLTQLFAAMRPFQEELVQLVKLEEVLQGEAVKQAFDAAEEAGISAQQRSKPNGQTILVRERSVAEVQRRNLRPYAAMAQAEAIRAILGKQDRVSAAELAELMRQGGYPFTSKNPKGSLATTIRQMVKRGELGVQKPVSHKAGAANKYFIGGRAPKKQRSNKLTDMHQNFADAHNDEPKDQSDS
jgi:hypothetical protein